MNKVFLERFGEIEILEDYPLAAQIKLNLVGLSISIVRNNTKLSMTVVHELTGQNPDWHLIVRDRWIDTSSLALENEIVRTHLIHGKDRDTWTRWLRANGRIR